jgi:hypothetical protein
MQPWEAGVGRAKTPTADEVAEPEFELALQILSHFWPC